MNNSNLYSMEEVITIETDHKKITFDNSTNDKSCHILDKQENSEIEIQIHTEERAITIGDIAIQGIGYEALKKFFTQL